MATALATCITAFPSMASIYSSSSLSNVRYTLIDLNLNDGIEPSISLSLNRSRIAGNIAGATGVLDEFSQQGILNSTIFANTSSDFLTSASASMQLNNFYATDLQTSGSLQTISSDKNRFNSYLSFAQDNRLFTLSGNTRVQFTGDAYTSVEITDTDSYSLFGGAFSRFLAKKNIDEIYGADDSTVQGTSLADLSLSEKKSLSIFIDNLTSENINGELDIYTVTYGMPGMSAVPVPAALPLMASALGIFGLARRRNKSKTA